LVANARDVLRRAPHHHQVGLAALEQAEQALAVLEAQLDVDARVLAAEGDEQHRDEVLGRRHHRQVDRAALQAASLGEGVVQVLQRRQCRQRQALELLAGRRELDAAPGLLHQRHAHRLLELAQLHRDRGLRDVQRLRRRRDAGVARHFGEGVELAQGVSTHQTNLIG
jgi:hypothetical protein